MVVAGILCLGSSGLLAQKTAAGVGPSFDCSTATSPPERAICADPDLAQLDREMSDVYATYRAALQSAAKTLAIASQREWVHLRDSCGSNANCLKQAMTARVAQLHLELSAANRADTVRAAVGTASSALSDAGNNVAGAAQQPTSVSAARTETSADVLARLANPPASLAPLRLPTLAGVPVVTAAGPRTVTLAEDRFLQLIAIGRGPAPAEDTNAIAERFLSAEERAALLRPEHFGSTDTWKGDNEFARARARSDFEQRILPVLREAAPKLPVSFAYTFETQLPVFDVATGAFALGKITDILNRLRDRLEGAGIVVGPRPDLQPTELLWKLSPAEAEHTLSRLAAFRGQTSPNRDIRLALTVNLRPNPQLPKLVDLSITSIKIYSPDFSQVLFEFPLPQENVPFITAAIPPRLKLTGPTELDGTYLAFKRLASTGALPDRTKQFLWSATQNRDGRFYNMPNAWNGLAPDDARRPFFPPDYMSIQENPEVTARFLLWAKAYAASLPDEAVVTQRRAGVPEGDALRFAAFSGTNGSARGLSDFAKLIAAGHLQSDQVVPQLENGEPVLLLLPNRASLYAGAIPVAEFGQDINQTVTIATSLRVGEGKLVADDRGQPVLEVAVQPLSMQVQSASRSVLSRRFDNVPTLRQDAFVAAPTAVAPHPDSAPLRLDGSLIDQIVTNALGEKLQPEALAHIILRRWGFENGKSAVSGARFFQLGKRAPSPQEAVGLGADFIAWARANAPRLPLPVIVDGRVEVDVGAANLRWSQLNCFARSFAGMMSDSNASMGVNGEIGSLTRKKALFETGTPIVWNEADAQRLARYSAIGQMLTEMFYAPLGSSCSPRAETLGFADPVETRLFIDHSLPLPSLTALGGKKALEIQVTLQLAAVSLSQTEPSLGDRLPPALASIWPHIPARAEPGRQFVTVDAHFLQARFSEPGGPEIARFGRERGDSMESLLGSLPPVSALPETEVASAVPDGPYGPDLVGVRLGMSFADAERAVRAHMKVGRVLTGRRAYAAAEQAGAIRPMDSGTLFVSEAEDELIALIDEPPVAKERVLAAWRRVSIPAGSIDTADIFEGIEKKYGKPGGNAGLRPGTLFSWFGPRGGVCRSIYDGGTAVNLSDVWFEDGRPLSRPLTNSPPQRTVTLPGPLFDPKSEQNRQYMGCGPFVNVQFLTAAMTRSARDELELSITDIGAYLKAYDKNRVRAQESGTASGAAPPIKF
jgi:uncharacterized protein